MPYRPAPIVASAAEVDPKQLLPMPGELRDVVLRWFPTRPARFRGSLIEANNIDLRGPRTPEGLFAADGRATAAAWRSMAQGSGTVFVLRDSLFSQQDHPYRQRGYAPMLPPNWVSLAVAHAAEGRPLLAPSLPAIEDDQAWQTLSDRELFGDFPVSASLRTHVRHDQTRPRAMALHARWTLERLRDDARQLTEAAGHSPQAVAEIGAELIAASDVHYFGRALRSESIAPIFVEHPNAKERAEGKGLEVPGRPIAAEHLALARRSIYGRRLLDGDLAVERYDISLARDRARAITLLRELIPADSTGHTVWLWVTGPLDPDKKLKGEDAQGYAEAFWRELEAAKLELSRLKLLSKPAIVLPEGKEFAPAWRETATRFRELDLTMSVLFDAGQFLRWRASD